MAFTGKHLIEWGMKPSRWFPQAIAAANAAAKAGLSHEEILAAAKAAEPPAPPTVPMRETPLAHAEFIELAGDGTAEVSNLNAVRKHMAELMRVPTLTAGAIMPDACVSGSTLGTIPVGGAVAAVNAIHPGFHSADICCSVAISVLGRDADPRKVLDSLQAVTHFGPTGRNDPIKPPAGFADLSDNPFLVGLEKHSLHQFATQGDGNHFAYVGRMRSSGRVAIVTHHGSRGFGAQLYKRGMIKAVEHTSRAAPEVPKHNSWIVADSRDGELYWEALQKVRLWTRESHYAIHDMAVAAAGTSVNDRFWNEHNFVLQKADGLFYHGKGATPSWNGFSADDVGLTLIPLNCSEPILIARHGDNPGALGFAPHGAGRNFSRTQHLKISSETFLGGPDGPVTTNAILEGELQELREKGLDIRAYSGVPDLSELPSAYKNAKAVRAQIEKFKLAEVVDEVLPFGSIMAGEFEKPWLKKKDDRARTVPASDAEADG